MVEIKSKRKLIIIGGGPAGYAAAIYAARAQLQPLVFAGEKHGGQLMLTTEVENYPGFKEGILGPELMLTMRGQAERFAAEVVDQNVLKVDLSARPFRIWTTGDYAHGNGHDTKGEYKTDALLITTGAESIPLGVKGERELTGRGVSYCAVCDAAFFKDKRVFVVGGGDAAMEDTMALTKFALTVTVIHRRERFRASKIMQERVLNNKKVAVWWNTQVVEVIGDGQKIRAIRVKNLQTGEEREEMAEGLFVAIGHTPATEFLQGSGVELDEKGYVITGMTYPLHSKFQQPNTKESLWLTGYPTMTTVEGVFAAGDNVDFKYRQAVTAAGYGVMAALDAERWLTDIE